MSGKKKLLLVDDDPAVTSYLVVKLSKLYDVVSTNDPREVVALAKREQPHVILSDIDMPEMNGGDVAAAVAAEPATASIPLVYLTALVSPQEAHDLGGHVGGRPGVSKRAALSELVEVIDRVTARGQSPD
jgi:CheY-like chemotaxis protein